MTLFWLLCLSIILASLITITGLIFFIWKKTVVPEIAIHRYLKEREQKNGKE